MNGNIIEEGSSIYFKSENLKVEIPQGKASVLKDYVNGKEVILGIRPEDIHEEPVFLEGSPNSIFTASVDVTENLGHEMLLYLNSNAPLIARVDGRSNTRQGDTVKLAIDMNKVHVFDKESELNVFFN